MRVRVIPVLAVTLFAALLASAQERPTQPDRRPGAGGQPGIGVDKAGMTSLDGSWTVVSAARDGKAVTGADKLSVTIKGNIVSFTGSGGAEKQMHPLRLEFGPRNTLRVSEANADGKFSDPGSRPGGNRPGADRPPGDRPVTQTNGTGATQPGRSGTDLTMGLTGVYVLTPDYLAVSVFDGNTMGRDGIRPGADRPGGRPGTRPGGTGTNPGGSGTAPGGTSSGVQPGGVGGALPRGTLSSEGAQLNTHLSVILKRNGGAGKP